MDRDPLSKERFVKNFGGRLQNIAGWNEGKGTNITRGEFKCLVYYDWAMMMLVIKGGITLFLIYFPELGQNISKNSDSTSATQF